MLAEVEKEIFEFWKRNKIPEKAMNWRKGRKKFFFIDGPPYATGYIHLGTAWNKILKDFYIRFFRMLGFDVWAQPGYDTHGVPIENKVEKKLGFKSKRDIEKFGIEKFNEECRKFATEFIDIMSGQFTNLGVWMDWENPYLTLENYYIESAWYTFKKAFEKGLLYKARYPVHVCPHCETAVAYNEIEYFKARDPSIAVKFRIRGKENEFLVIWTTTPWTLVANVAIMVNPNFEYARVRVGGETLVIAKDLVEKTMERAGIENYEILETISGRELEGVRYEPVFPELPVQKKLLADQRAHRVVLSEQYVTLEEGTGLVHCAPGHGKEDYKVGKEYGLPVVCPVGMNGKYTEEAGKYAGKFVKDADKEIIEDLRNKGVLLYEEQIVHDYPQCWRCKSPLLILAVEQWFFAVTRIREKLLEENERVYWIPAFAKERFRNWLESLDDWPISRQRYWGIPLPIWVCERCGRVRVVGSTSELPKVPQDLHRPYIDEISLECECSGKMRRVRDVLDVWFDSGVATWASLKYPREKALFEEMWPSDLQIEGPDQIRGWWNSQLITGVITFGKAPFKAIIMHGLVLDEKGVKMSKSLGNIVNPEEVAGKYGRDVLRFALLRSDPANDFYFSWREMSSVYKFFTILMNVYNYFATYCTYEKLDERVVKEEDKWLLSKFNSLLKAVLYECKRYHGYRALQLIEKFVVEDLSRWYVKLVRDRNDRGVSAVLSYVLENLLKLLAPAIPFLTEYLYQRHFRSFAKRESVHLCDYPRAEERFLNENLEKAMSVCKEIAEACFSARHDAKIKLRYPLRNMKIVASEQAIKHVKSLEGVLKKICNVKEITYEIGEMEYGVKLNYALIGKRLGRKVKEIEREIANLDIVALKREMEERGFVTVAGERVGKDELVFVPKGKGYEFSHGYVTLDTGVDESLKKEWLLRELVRSVQETRKKLGLKVGEEAKLLVSRELEGELRGFFETLEKETNCRVEVVENLEGAEELEFEGKKYRFGVAR